MKHVIIGDLHGRDIWKEAPMDDQSKFIFLGDYVDSLRKSDHEILDNLREVIAFKARYPWRVVLLTGNHDAQYMYYPHYRCAGFRASAQPALTKLFRANDHHFAYAYQVRNMLFTHAGVTNAWFRQLKCDEVYRRYRYGNKPIADTMNAMRRNAHAPVLFTPCRVRTGEDSDGSAVWADAKVTWDDALDGYHQFVGHTPMDQPCANISAGKSITYLDVLHKWAYFHEVDI